MRDSREMNSHHTKKDESNPYPVFIVNPSVNNAPQSIKNYFGNFLKNFGNILRIKKLEYDINVLYTQP